MQLAVQPAEHHGGLLPGGGPAGNEQILAHAVHQAHFVGHSNVAPVGGHVPEREGGFGKEPRHGAVSHGPEQHHRQLLPGDGIGGAEGIRLPGDGPVLIAGPEGRFVPRPLGHVGKHLIIGSLVLPAEKPAQHHGKGRPGHGLAHAEGSGALALEPALGHALADGLRGPVAGGHVCKSGGLGRHRQSAAQQGAQAQAGRSAAQNIPFHLGSSL